jgi:hypothetical protein
LISEAQSGVYAPTPSIDGATLPVAAPDCENPFGAFGLSNARGLTTSVFWFCGPFESPLVGLYFAAVANVVAAM